MLFDELSVSENIFVGQYLYKGLLKTLDWPAMHRRANEILTRLEVQIDPRATLKPSASPSVTWWRLPGRWLSTPVW